MKNLAGAIIDHWWWIQRCEEEMKMGFGDEIMGDHYESMAETLDGLDPKELQAIRNVAEARLTAELHAGPAEWGFSRSREIVPEERELLMTIMNWGRKRKKKLPKG